MLILALLTTARNRSHLLGAPFLAAMPPVSILCVTNLTCALSNWVKSHGENAKPLEAFMSSFSYEAVDPSGLSVSGILDVTSQGQALRRIKEMGLFPTRIREKRSRAKRQERGTLRTVSFMNRSSRFVESLGGGIKPRVLTVFTRQLATLLDAGMPLLRGLRILQEQSEDRRLKSVIGRVSSAIEEGESLSEALAAQPKVFNSLYLNLVRAGEVGGSLEMVLERLAQFREKVQRMKGKVVAALFYPVAVLLVAMAILTVLIVFVVPRFKEVFDGLLGGAPMPAFTLFVFNLSDIARHQAPWVLLTLFVAGAIVGAALQTRVGRWLLDELKLKAPLIGNVFRKASVARLTRTLGMLIGSGVPVLQALTIARNTAGNVVVAQVIAEVHDSVKQGDPIAPTLRASRVFPAIVAGMVDVGEQTGALPEMLLKVAENYDDEVDNAVTAMTSLLEPIMIVLLAIIVGSIVIALFLPIITAGEFV